MNYLKNKRIVFHGTDEKFSKFSNDLIGLGGDPNSCLGIFFAEDPSHAAEYAGENGMIVIGLISDENPFIKDLEHQVVLVPEVLKNYEQDCINNNSTPLTLNELDFFETQDDYKICAYFAREHYVKLGHDNLQYCEVGSDTQICVALHSEDIEILRTLTYDEAMLLSEKMQEQNDFYNQEERLKNIESLVKPVEKSTKVNSALSALNGF